MAARLTCAGIRLAIDAGSGLIIPPIACNRSRSDNMDLSTSVCADEFWNMEQLEEGLHKQCPQLQLRFCGDIGGIDTTLHLPHVEYHGAALQPGDLNASIAASLSEAQISEVSETSPVVIFFADPYTGFNYSARGETATVRKDLFKVLNFNEHLLSISGLLSQDHRLSHGYIGVHFRAEPDWPYDFGTAEEQLQHYLEYLETIRTTSPEMTTIYISCGFEEAVEHFREKVAPLGFTVIDKWLLLQEHPAMLEEVNSMNFDQQAIVEYSLMVGADYFTGNMVSTLSMVIAYARTMDEEPEFFPSYILDGSHREPPKRRYWDVAPAMHGHNTTRLMVVNLGVGANIDFYDTLP